VAGGGGGGGDVALSHLHARGMWWWVDVAGTSGGRVTRPSCVRMREGGGDRPCRSCPSVRPPSPVVCLNERGWAGHHLRLASDLLLSEGGAGGGGGDGHGCGSCVSGLSVEMAAAGHARGPG
jgi:hypothetical protein